MNSPLTQFATSRRMGIYEPFHQICMWEGDSSLNTGASTIIEVDAILDNKVKMHESEFISRESIVPSSNHQEANQHTEKVWRRLAQNREAARKSRLKRKAYVQQLESSRLKLAQLEQELNRARQQGHLVSGGLDTGHVGLSGTVNPGIAAFEMEYGHWLEEQHRLNCQMRNALQTHITDIELRILVESTMNHYYNLFRMKGDATKADVFYLTSGMWRTSVERFFLWIGGFRPSELLNVVMPQLEPLTAQQLLDVGNLRQSSQQAEDALSQGMEKLQQTLAQSMAEDPLSTGVYGSHIADAMEKLETLENFVTQADHLRKQTLQQIYRILTVRQAARGLLALGEYFDRLRALSSLWAARPREPA